jgi:hypothetical protein
LAFLNLPPGRAHLLNNSIIPHNSIIARLRRFMEGLGRGAWPDPAGSGKIRPGLSRGSATYFGRDGPELGPGASDPRLRVWPHSRAPSCRRYSPRRRNPCASVT